MLFGAPCHVEDMRCKQQSFIQMSGASMLPGKAVSMIIQTAV